MAKRKSVSGTIRKTIRARKLSGYRISKDTGIPQSALSEFMRAERNLGSQHIDTLCEYLGLELREIE
jgi:predicted XRE-type DNA-binding protein